jgi:hypothetical protein
VGLLLGQYFHAWNNHLLLTMDEHTFPQTNKIQRNPYRAEKTIESSQHACVSSVEITSDMLSTAQNFGHEGAGHKSAKELIRLSKPTDHSLEIS